MAVLRQQKTIPRPGANSGVGCYARVNQLILQLTRIRVHMAEIPRTENAMTNPKQNLKTKKNKMRVMDGGDVDGWMFPKIISLNTKEMRE